MGDRPWRGPGRRYRGSRWYTQAMVTLVNAALPASTALVPSATDTTGLPAGLNDADAAASRRRLRPGLEPVGTPLRPGTMAPFVFLTATSDHSRHWRTRMDDHNL